MIRPSLLTVSLSVVLAGCTGAPGALPDADVERALPDQLAADRATADDRSSPAERAREAGLPDAAACPSLEGKSFTLLPIEVIGGAPIYPDLEIGPDDQPVVAFTKGSPAERYPVVSRFDGKAWSPPEIVEKQAGRYLGKRPSLALDPDGRLHVTSYDEDGGRLHYATRPAAGTWQVELLWQAGVDAGDHSSLARASNGTLHLSFLEYGSYHLIYGTRSPTGWSLAPLQAAGAPLSGSSTSLAVDAGGRPHLAYFTGQHLHYASQQGASWIDETVDASTDMMGHYPTLALDAKGAPLIAYLDWSSAKAVRLARRTPGGWTTETVDQALGISYTTGLALLPCGTTLIAYARNDGEGPPGLRLAVRDPALAGGRFSLLAVDEKTYVSGIDLAVAASGRLHLVYLDETNFVLRHAELSP